MLIPFEVEQLRLYVSRKGDLIREAVCRLILAISRAGLSIPRSADAQAIVVRHYDCSIEAIFVFG